VGSICLRARSCAIAVATAWLVAGHVAIAQELEPGAYAIAPVGVNVLVVSNTLSSGDMAFDPSGPIEDGRGTINVTTVGYGRAWSLMGRLTQVVVALPMVTGRLEGRVLGEFASVDRFGLGDPRVRLAVNVYGAPAMDRKAFAAHRPSTIVGVSLTTAVPLGQYSRERLINIGNARWAFKPEIGVVHAIGRWTIETYGGVWLFTTNDRFYGGTERSQRLIGSAQLHVQYAVRPRLVISGNANFYTGGRTTIDGRDNLDLQRNSRVGVTLVRPLSRGRTLRLAVSRGAYTTIGADFTSLSVGFQQVWGGG
jgi:hypothetical protein